MGADLRTGYGQQVALFAPLLAEAGYAVSISAFYGAEASPTRWNGIPVLPGLGGEWGNDTLVQHAAHVFGGDPKAGIVLTLMDVWPLEPALGEKLNLVCWTPVDHEPAPPRVWQMLHKSGAVPVAMTRHGERMLGLLDPLYVPHGCFDYDAAVLVPGGRSERLGDIVAERSSTTHVIGMDGNGNCQPTSILDRQCIELRDSHALRVRTAGGRSMVITRDNEVMTARGWVAAGSLSLTDCLATVDVERINATRTGLDIGGAREAARAVSSAAEGRIARRFPRTHISGIADASTTDGLGATGGGGVQATELFPPTVERDRTGLHCGDHRRRRAHHGREIPSTSLAVSALHATGWSYEPVRGTDPVDGRAHCVDDSEFGRRRGSVGLGLSTVACGSWRSASIAGAHTAPSDQAQAGGVDRTVLRDACRQDDKRPFERSGDRGRRRGAITEPPQTAAYDQIVAIERVDLNTVYDITTETGNFFVDGILVHNCDTSVYVPMDREQARRGTIPPGAFMAGMVAANKGHPSRKGFPQALEAFARFAARHDDAYLYLHTVLDANHGHGVDLHALIAAVGIPEDRIRKADQYALMHSPYSDRQMASIYSALDVLLNCSFGEGFGVPVIEAASCSVPSIVTDFTAMPEVAGPAAWRVGHHPYWSGLNSWQATPKIDEIDQALEACYQQSESERAARAKAARAHAELYDARRVLSDYFLPALRAAEQRFAAREPVRIPSRLEAVAA